MSQYDVTMRKYSFWEILGSIVAASSNVLAFNSCLNQSRAARSFSSRRSSYSRSTRLTSSYVAFGTCLQGTSRATLEGRMIFGESDVV